MILPDVNLLLYAHVEQYRNHMAARMWWDRVMNGRETVGLSWTVILGFVRIATQRGVLEVPMPVELAEGYVRKWLAQPCTRIVEPGPRHIEILFRILRELGTAANLTTDAHLAAIASELGGVVFTTDADFARIPGMKWVNPLKNE